MKLTPELKQWLEKETKRYCKQLSIKPPVLIFTKKELADIQYATPQMEKKIKGKEFNYAGLTFDGWKGHPDKIFLNIRGHNTMGELIDTLVHELVHLKFDWHNSDHGKFNKVITDIIIGKRF